MTPPPESGSKPAEPAVAGEPELVAVGRIGKAHGLRGEVAVEAWTDDPDARMAVGAVLRVDPDTAPPSAPSTLTVLGSHWHSGRLLVTFDQVLDRTGAESLRGILLLVPAAARPAIDDPDEFYDSDLIGLTARTTGGEQLGPVADVVHGPGGDYLAVMVGERERLVPFVAAIVPVVDVSGGFVEIDAPEGLLDL